jgi:hypothetical protein
MARETRLQKAIRTLQEGGLFQKNDSSVMCLFNSHGDVVKGIGTEEFRRVTELGLATRKELKGTSYWEIR